MNQETQLSSATGQLVGEETCIALLFEPDARPAPRTWRKWKKRRLMPYVRIGRLCFYDVESVRKSLLGKYSILPR